MRYKLIDRIPEEMQCAAVACPTIYELTPEELRCGVGACPAIYETKELTPKDMICSVGICPAIYDYTPKEMQCLVGSCQSIHGSEDNYLIIGTKVNPADFGLEKKVGENEILIQVPKKLIDKMKRE